VRSIDVEVRRIARLLPCELSRLAQVREAVGTESEAVELLAFSIG